MCAGLSLQSIGKGWQVVGRDGDRDIFGSALQQVFIVGSICAIIIQSCAIQASIVMEAARGNNYKTFYQNTSMQRLAEQMRRGDLFRVATVVPNRQEPPHAAFSWAYGLESADGYVSLYPKRYQDLWAKVLEPLLKTDPLLASYFTAWGNRVYLFSPLFFYQANVLDYHRRFDVTHLHHLKFLSLLNVKYLISPLILQDDDLALRSART